MADEGRNTIIRYSNSIVLRCQLNKIVSINASLIFIRTDWSLRKGRMLDLTALWWRILPMLMTSRYLLANKSLGKERLSNSSFLKPTQVLEDSLVHLMWYHHRVRQQYIIFNLLFYFILFSLNITSILSNVSSKRNLHYPHSNCRIDDRISVCVIYL